MGAKIDRTGEITYNNQNEKITIKTYRNWNDIDVEFEDGIVVKHRSYSGFKRGEIKHPIKYEDSFAYYIIEELKLNLNDIWDWEKNKYNPYEILKGSDKKIYVYCSIYDYHNDYGSHSTTCYNFYKHNTNGCQYCSKRKVHPKDSFAQWGIDKYGNDFLNKYWNWNKNNKLGLNPWNLRPNSHKKVWLLCSVHDYHNDYGGYEATCNKFYSNSNCPYCSKIKVHPKDSFAQYHTDNTDKDFINKYWSDKNVINPWSIHHQSFEKVYIKCQEKDYHNYDKNGNELGYEIICNMFTIGHRCNYCNGNHKTHYKDSLAYNYPHVAMMIAIPKNNLTFDDCYDISCGSGKKFYYKCLNCNQISNKNIAVNDLKNNCNTCEYCSDGISILNKWIRNLLKILNLDFISEYHPYYFKPFSSVDILIPSMSIIIEMDGNYGNHIPEYDYWRDFLNMKYGGYKTIRIKINDDTKYKNNLFLYLKEETIKELKDIINFDNINWDELWKTCQNSMVKMAWDLWNDGLDVKSISNKLNLSGNTISRYLQRGRKLNMCNYTNKEARNRANNNKMGRNNSWASTVICLTTKRIFFSQREAIDYYNLAYNGISSCCRGERKYSGKLEDGTKLVWRYINTHHNRTLRGNDISKLHSKI